MRRMAGPMKKVRISALPEYISEAPATRTLVVFREWLKNGLLKRVGPRNYPSHYTSRLDKWDVGYNMGIMRVMQKSWFYEFVTMAIWLWDDWGLQHVHHYLCTLLGGRQSLRELGYTRMHAILP
ncbi:hypothetical protein L484_022979 [Morus notabilis]|uniref:Uncharacterized protein n=1 Tax=Morus notabilis TaxID=981085 RepID=W9RVR4_9ROSA|nr:hypothetical protein L484_022979 [Morus notabilis]